MNCTIEWIHYLVIPLWWLILVVNLSRLRNTQIVGKVLFIFNPWINYSQLFRRHWAHAPFADRETQVVWHLIRMGSPTCVCEGVSRGDWCMSGWTEWEDPPSMWVGSIQSAGGPDGRKAEEGGILVCSSRTGMPFSCIWMSELQIAQSLDSKLTIAASGALRPLTLNWELHHLPWLSVCPGSPAYRAPISALLRLHNWVSQFP